MVQTEVTFPLQLHYSVFINILSSLFFTFAHIVLIMLNNSHVHHNQQLTTELKIQTERKEKEDLPTSEKNWPDSRSPDNGKWSACAVPGCQPAGWVMHRPARCPQRGCRCSEMGGAVPRDCPRRRSVWASQHHCLYPNPPYIKTSPRMNRICPDSFITTSNRITLCCNQETQYNL